MEDNTPTPRPEPKPQSTGESSSTPKLETSEAGQQTQPPEETEERKQPELPKILEPIYAFFVRLVGPRWGPTLWIGATVFLSAASALVTLLWTLALWDSYRPKITVVPGGTLNSKVPFATFFILQNQGALPIEKITYLTRLTAIVSVAATNQTFASQEQNVTIIPQMKPLEAYSLSIHYPGVQIKISSTSNPTNQPVNTNQITSSNPPQMLALFISFDVSYHPKFFGERTDTLYFAAVPDVDGNWQWLPTAHQSMADQIIDTNLLPHIPASVAPVAIPTNGGIKAHTN